MINRKAVYEQLKKDEGVKYEIYQDHLGYLTFGVGHLITDEDPESGLSIGTKISEERVYTAFQYDVDMALWDCEMLYGPVPFYSWPEEVKQVLVNMMFNLGRTRLGKFVNFKAALMDKNWKLAAKEGRDSLWYHQVKSRAENLMSRLEKVS